MIRFRGTHADYGQFLANRLRQNGHSFYNTANMNTLARQLKIYQTFYLPQEWADYADRRYDFYSRLDVIALTEQYTGEDYTLPVKNYI